MKFTIHELSITRTLGIIFLLVALVSSIFIVTAIDFIKENTVNEIAFNEASKTSELIFQNLYSVMKRGWSKTDIEDVIKSIQATIPEIDIRLFRSAAVEEIYGSISDSFHPQQRDQSVLTTLQTGEKHLIEKGSNLRFLYPIHQKEECSVCHHNSKVGDISGVLEIVLPITKLKTPIEYTISSIIYLIIAITLLLGMIIYFSVRHFLVVPIKDLSDHIDTVTHDNHIETRVPIVKSACLEINTLRDTFNSLLNRLEKAYRKIRKRSEKDPLTGLFNRRKFDEIALYELKRSRRHKYNFSLFLIDLNLFKPINDLYGHDAGDEILCNISNAVQSGLRDEDTLARIGGDEFLILAPETYAENALILAERINEIIRSTTIFREGKELSVGCSIGIAKYPDDGENIEVLFKVADKRMYEQKREDK